MPQVFCRCIAVCALGPPSHHPLLLVGLLFNPAGEAALRAAQLELQLQTRKQAADVEMAQTQLQQQAAALVRPQHIHSSGLTWACRTS